MNLTERLAFFQELISCNYRVYLWTYDENVTFIRTNCPKELIAGDMITLLGFSPAILAHVEQNGFYPLFLDTDFGLIWIAAFECQNGSLHRIHVIGPAFSGKNTHLLMKKKLDSYNLSVKLRSLIFRQLDDVPIIPSTTLLQYAVMLHYSITGTRITSDRVYFSPGDKADATDDIPLISGEHRGIWLAEQKLLQMIRDGNPDYKSALEKCMSLSAGLKAELGDSMRQNKNNSLVLLTLCSRAAIQGGLPPSTAYTLNDYYAKKIEDCRTVSEITEQSRSMLKDYVERVRQAKEAVHNSSQIQTVCDYIDLHYKEKITLSELSKIAGYTEYYLSHKFRQETGYTVNRYIQNKKLKEAELLLAGTSMSISAISDALSFGSRSYFYSCFQKATGLSPSEYREKYYRL